MGLYDLHNVCPYTFPEGSSCFTCLPAENVLPHLYAFQNFLLVFSLIAAKDISR